MTQIENADFILFFFCDNQRDLRAISSRTDVFFYLAQITQMTQINTQIFFIFFCDNQRDLRAIFFWFRADAFLFRADSADDADLDADFCFIFYLQKSAN